MIKFICLSFYLLKPNGVGGIGIGNTVNINFCASCSYRYLNFATD